MVSKAWRIHRLIYVLLSAIYVAYCFGADKTVTAGLLALTYLTLAILVKN